MKNLPCNIWGVASIEGADLIVFYYLSASKIQLDKTGDYCMLNNSVYPAVLVHISL
jgi:hypothetical protein